MKPHAKVARCAEEHAESNEANEKGADEHAVGPFHELNGAFGSLVHLVEEGQQQKDDYEYVDDCAEGEEDAHEHAPERVLMAEDAVSPPALALWSAHAPQACGEHITAVAPLVPGAGRGRGDVKYGQQHAHVDGCNQAKLELAEFSHEHHNCIIFVGILFKSSYKK